MAKATDNVSTVKLTAALERAAESYGAAEGKRRILEGLKSGELRAFGFRKHSNKLIPIPVEFWHDKPVDHPIDYGGLPYRQVHIDWAEGSARWDWNDDVMFGIQLAGNDFVKPLPTSMPDTRAARRPSPAKTIACELFPPDGHAPQKMATNVAMKKLADEMDRQGVGGPRSDDTLRRALGRR